MSETTTILPFPLEGGGPSPLLPAIEALLFAAGEPVGLRALIEALGTDPSANQVRDALKQLERRYERSDSGLLLYQMGTTYQIRTDPRFSRSIAHLLGMRPKKLSRAALEVVAIIAYEQPVIRMEVERVRGVDCGGVIRSLIDKGLVRPRGRRDVPGRPMEYGTTRGFLELFSLPDISALPQQEDLGGDE